MAKREDVIAFWEENDWSFRLIADHFGLTRNQVAGYVFRHRHEGRLRGTTKIGIGHHGPGKYPAFTARA